MYFVDKTLLNKRLNYIESMTKEVDTDNPLALERACLMLIEATVDVGNMIIDAFILRDPGSYQDVIDIMAQEKVINDEDAEKFKNTLKWRLELTRKGRTSVLVVVAAGINAGDEDVDDELDDEVHGEIGDCREYEADEQVPVTAEAGQRDEDGCGDRRKIRDQSEDGGFGLAHGAESSNGVPELRCGV